MTNIYYNQWTLYGHLVTWCDLSSDTVDSLTQPIKVDLNKKLDSKQKTIQIFNIDAQGLRKTKNINPPTREIRVTS